MTNPSREAGELNMPLLERDEINVADSDDENDCQPPKRASAMSCDHPLIKQNSENEIIPSSQSEIFY
jgi:hypothetical protein